MCHRKFAIQILYILLFSLSLSAQEKTVKAPRIVSIGHNNYFPLVQKRSSSPILIDSTDAQVVAVAAEAVAKDIEQISNVKPRVIHSLDIASQYIIIAGTIGQSAPIDQLISENKLDVSKVKDKWETYTITTIEAPIKGVKQALVIAGSDRRGTAFGLFQISRMAGISPWIWWADSKPTYRKNLFVTSGTCLSSEPSVKYRGIFLNDEDWGIMPWSSKTFEPSETKGQLGPKTHARIFELLLRLRANSFWPAMHECSVAFYMTPGNREVADKYAIVVGTSHCEPMMRNSNYEWKKLGTGEYNYITNRDHILKFWEERTTSLVGSENIYTLGIRGVHDGKMQGANTVEEQKTALTQILQDQREMLKRATNADIEKTPQIFVPYKEVLDVYNAGLKIPEDVTLVWCDDNYGYITHFPDSLERNRKGGSGLYYHLSYWGRPHDYLWLSTTHPAQIYYQLKTAYDKGIRNLWMINVGDIKPAEYPLELIMDMAWNIEQVKADKSGLDDHLKYWLKREFGSSISNSLLQVMAEYYRLAYIRKPEFMGNTRTEEKDPSFKVVRDLPMTEKEIHRRLTDYTKIEKEVEKLTAKISKEKQSSWFQLVEYPVRAASEMNKKILFGQLARHGKSNWAKSDSAYSEIVRMTKRYNTLSDGKWQLMMDHQPRKLSVFDRLPHDTTQSNLIQKVAPLHLFNGNEYSSFVGKKPTELGLGYERKAIVLDKNTTVKYAFRTKNSLNIEVEIALAPNHPVEGNQIRYAISIDGEPEQTIEYRTEGRSEEWKLNVLSNHALRRVKFSLRATGKHTLNIRAIDEGVILDQIAIVDSLLTN